MRDYGLVSIVTPTYNCGRFIAETIDSVLGQTYQNWEMLIVDDCSTDNTAEVVEGYVKNDSRIKYYRLDKNSGAAIARNKALSLAKGGWIAFLDSDDLWLPAKLERQLKFMFDNGYAFTYHNYEEIDERGCRLNVFVSGIKKVSRLKMFSCCWPGCLSVMYDAKSIGLIQVRDVKKNNDTAIWLQVVGKANCYLFNENLALYRRRKGSITPTSLWRKIWAHYPLFRTGEQLSPIAAGFWTIVNVFGNAYKKLFFVKSIYDYNGH